MSINHNLQYINRQNWVRHDKLKTESSRRIIGLDDNTLAVLQEWHERQAKVDTISFILSPDGNPYPKTKLLNTLDVQALKPFNLKDYDIFTLYYSSMSTTSMLSISQDDLVILMARLHLAYIATYTLMPTQI